MHDVAIVGLGTAGAAAAAACATAGLSVVGIDTRPLDATGARWLNGVPRWVFDASGFAAPEPPIVTSDGARCHIVAGWGPEKVAIDGLLELDMRHLTADLLRRAADAGADLRGEVRFGGLDADRMRTSEGDLRARVFVDASGLTGARLLDQPSVPREHLCAAVQEVRHVGDVQAARRFFEDNGAAPGEVLIFTSVAGGYSIVNVRLDGDELSILTGSIPGRGEPSGRALVDAFVAEHPWVGDRIFGGGRAIPLGPLLPCIGTGNIALVGDAARQVYSAHGSGIALQLLAARTLATALTDGSGPAGYNLAFQRGWGGLIAGSDLFRRFSTTLGPGDVAAMMHTGAMSPPMMLDVLQQRQPRPPPGAALASAAGLARLPGIARRLLPVLLRMQAVRAHYRLYPRNPARLPAWERALDRLTR